MESLETVVHTIIGASSIYSKALGLNVLGFEPDMYYGSKTAAYYNRLLKPHGYHVTPKNLDGYVYILKIGNYTHE